MQNGNSSLLDEVFAYDNLSEAYDFVAVSARRSKNESKRQARRRVTRVEEFVLTKDVNIGAIISSYKAGEEIKFRRNITKIPKAPGGEPKRPISLFSLLHRVILRSTLSVVWPRVEPLIQPAICYCTFRKGGLHPPRGMSEAVKLTAALRAEFPYIFETDISGFFDSLDRHKLLSLLDENIDDKKLLQHVNNILEAEVTYNQRYFTEEEMSDNSSGVPQGAPLSPLLACIYLSPFDNNVSKAGMKMIRYVDDLIILCRTRAEAEQSGDFIRDQLLNEFGLQLNLCKTQIVAPNEELTFLGHRIAPDGIIKPSAKRVDIVTTKVRSIVSLLPGTSDAAVAQLLTSYLLGFFLSMRHCNFTNSEYGYFATVIKDELMARRLAPNRLTRLLFSCSNKWPDEFRSHFS